MALHLFLNLEAVSIIFIKGSPQNVHKLRCLFNVLKESCMKETRNYNKSIAAPTNEIRLHLFLLHLVKVAQSYFTN